MSELGTLLLLTLALWGLIELAQLGWKKWSLLEPKSERLFEAGISRHIVPRLDPYICSSSILYIIGYDGSYVRNRRGAFWLKHLKAWMERGCRIHYLLCCPDADAAAQYARLASQYEGRFSYYEFATSQRDTQIAQLVQKYETFHPILLDVGADGGRAMWIEHYHPKNSEFAYAIEFVSPTDGRQDRRFDEYLDDFKILMSSASAQTSARLASASEQQTLTQQVERAVAV